MNVDTETQLASAADLPAAITAVESSSPKPERPSILVEKPIPYTFDLGNLLCTDSNPLPPSPSEALIASTARDTAQALINQLLTTCPITSSPSTGVMMTLPLCTTPLPREKPLPAPKQETTWEKFAKKKGIKDKGKGNGEGKMVYDEAKGEWVTKWGYKGRNKDGEGEWIVEVDEKKEREAEGEGKHVRGDGRRARVEKVRRNERKQRANERRGRKKDGGVGV